ncbi:hypothetical protein SMACR_01517 [Sordaria macrospora]|uniref:WGS project CABT00000000 data, contig 2.4 n=2 Tax=Sordaria macrospora TaxID=5147 RepID=F7VR21_SORMK|nr:uncharacterized protein SMAC_01517 [Sordaria macrospora k-hell]KAA8623946.1 hypothetical protein SMACR_01517 [Sordaria macrospora]CCC07954.1 unnamed protein product [Sordaria macrospora k-hell]
MPFALASCSIGLPKHTLHQKIEAIRHAGFDGIELSFPDLQSYANLHFGRDIAEDDYDTLCEAGQAARQLVERHNLKIFVLQPFSNFEGWPEGSEKRKDAFARARGWIRIMEAVGTDMLQVGSSDSEGIATDPDLVAADLQELADMLAEKGFKLAPNVGLCLDTFQSAGGEWGDPTTESGRIETPAITEMELSVRYRASLKELAETVPVDKIFFFQISDAYKAQPPLEDKPDTESGLRPRGRWSHDYRPLPYDGGYLPIEQFAKAVLDTGFKGWFSVEVFDGKFEEKFGQDLNKYAEKAIDSCKELLSKAKETQ